MLQCASVVLPLTRLPGAAPELNPGWVCRRKNTCPEVRYATHRLLKTDKQTKPNSTVCHARAIKNQQTKTPSTLYHAQTIKN